MSLTNLNIDHCYKLAIELALYSGKIIKDNINREKCVEVKTSPRDLVTETDKAIEEHVIKSISVAFPTHRFIGEESVAAGEKCELTNEPTWIIDPVDGTLNFVHSFSYTCISIGFWIDKHPVFGVIYNPILEQMYTARKGQGAYLNDKPIKVSGNKEISKSLMISELGTRHNAKKMQVIIKNFINIASRSQGIRSMGSAALDIANVADGGMGGYYEIGIHAWDMAAGVLLVTEAGGYVCDVDGKPFDLMGRRIICAASKELALELVNLLEIYEEERD